MLGCPLKSVTGAESGLDGANGFIQLHLSVVVQTGILGAARGRPGPVESGDGAERVSQIRNGGRWAGTGRARSCRNER